MATAPAIAPVKKTSVIAVAQVTLDPCQADIRVAIIDYCLWLASVNSNWSRSISGAGAALSTARIISGLGPAAYSVSRDISTVPSVAMTSRHARANRLPNTGSRTPAQNDSGSCFSMRVVTREIGRAHV